VVVAIDDKHSKELAYEYNAYASGVVGEIIEVNVLQILLPSFTTAPKGSASND
jgi:hypothetical protein